MKTLSILGERLLMMQVTEQADSNYGALRCPESGLFHTRAAEAVYPFAVLYKMTHDERYSKAAIWLGNWLIRQQQPGGEWLETPWTWTGTTADQLLMMSLAYPVLKSRLTEVEKSSWQKSIVAAADYLFRVMNPDFATINYCATTPVSLMAVNEIFPNADYVKKARQLSRMVLSKMNSDGFIDGEAARIGNVKYGADPAYEIDMSFWGLLLYAKLNKDTVVTRKIREAVEKHLPLVYPNGIIDGSWGTRCYKWTTYGSKTADGCQMLFSLLSESEAVYRTAAWRNLEYLRTMISGGMIGCGPQYFEMTSELPCIYPTFARAKTLAMAAELGAQSEGPLPDLPSDKPGFSVFYPSVHVAAMRTENFYVTISAYQYIDQMNWGQGRYSQFPSGGSACNIWVKDFGLLQTSSPTRYVQGEVIHMPVIPEDSIRPFTPRIEFTDSGKYYTNLYEHSPVLAMQRSAGNEFVVTVSGELKNEQNIPGGIGYTLTHQIGNAAIEKTIELRYHDCTSDVSIVEPVVYEKGMEVELLNPRSVEIRYSKKSFILQIVKGNVNIEAGKDIGRYWQPFPAMRCYPIVIKINAPARPFDDENYKNEVSYKIMEK